MNPISFKPLPFEGVGYLDTFQKAFKAYDIRGVVDVVLTADFAYLLGLAIAARCRALQLPQIVVGRDGRLSGPSLSKALCHGLQAGGIHVIDIGMVPTPVVYYACYALNTQAGIAITGSHNPPEYNGFKMVLGQEAIYGDAIQDLARTMQSSAIHQVSAPQGTYRQQCVLSEYVQRIVGDIHITRPMHIAIDCGNGVAGVVAQQLFEQLGCKVTPLFTTVDGRFPNHHPDPADPHNLIDLQKALATTDAELGLAFDGDGDRLGVVTKSGAIIWPDRQLILFARDVLERVPGGTIIYDVKCSRLVAKAVTEAGGVPLMWKTGHSLVKAKLRETQAPLAGEMSGHIFFKERWYGFDDGLYTAARLLEICARSPNPSALLEELPDAISTPELKWETAEGEQFERVAQLQQQAVFEGAIQVHTVDGIRVEYVDGFGLARASNTTPVVVLRFEADTAAALTRIQAQFASQIRRMVPDASLPF